MRRGVFDAGVCSRRGLAVSECCETVGTQGDLCMSINHESRATEGVTFYSSRERQSDD